jgi:hypothetical protein
MKPTLDPEDALSGPLYLVAAMLVIVPLVDFSISVPPGEFSDSDWRFSAFGLLSGHLLLPVLGLAMAFVVASILKHHSIQRLLVAFCLTMSLVLIVVTVVFLLDMGDVRLSVSNERMPAFTSAANAAIVRLVFASIVVAFLGWRARRMIPVRSHHKTPKPVHVVSK